MTEIGKTQLAQLYGIDRGTLMRRLYRYISASELKELGYKKSDRLLSANLQKLYYSRAGKPPQKRKQNAPI